MPVAGERAARSSFFLPVPPTRVFFFLREERGSLRVRGCSKGARIVSPILHGSGTTLCFFFTRHAELLLKSHVP